METCSRWRPLTSSEPRRAGGACSGSKDGSELEFVFCRRNDDESSETNVSQTPETTIPPSRNIPEGVCNEAPCCALRGGWRRALVDHMDGERFGAREG